MLSSFWRRSTLAPTKFSAFCRVDHGLYLSLQSGWCRAPGRIPFCWGYLLAPKEILVGETLWPSSCQGLARGCVRAPGPDFRRRQHGWEYGHFHDSLLDPLYLLYTPYGFQSVDL
jgi:hypothetical protein